ncbi:MAG TPA: bifunctional glutamate N-acetyltransferase/amino-acid acetyltransferase ArgJ [Thermodesulfobium narugense]|nr:bifunctional glutamate N-acetyltransferase/amino-acid acetyltransferase ArgJ [Thermodesulfobium narugense]
MSNFPENFNFAGLSCGLKLSGKKDLGAIFCKEKALTFALFTQNSVAAAPVKISKERLKKNKYIRAILINSGNANAATGIDGYNDAIEISKRFAELIGVREDEVLLASTGIIGVRLDKEKIISKIPELVNNLKQNNYKDFVESIMTTDSFEKEYFEVISSEKNDEIHIRAYAKGCGMICPNLATMLVFITSDINADEKILKEIFVNCVNRSFNAISVDGDTSTNDSAFFMTDMLYPKNKITNRKDKLIMDFESALNRCCTKLANDMVKDGEGSTKVLEVRATGFTSEEEAKKVASNIAKSTLVKCAFFGSDPNWGRIICAAGNTNLISEDSVLIKIFDTAVYNKKPINFDKASLRKKISNSERVIIEIHNNAGDKDFTFYGCDLTFDYVKLNSEYST